MSSIAVRARFRRAFGAFLRAAFPALMLAFGVATLPRAAHAQGSLLFDSKGTSDKPQSKLFVLNDSWWACVNNLTKLSIYKLSAATWTKKLDVVNAIVPFDEGGTNDVLWDGTNLFIATWDAATPKLYKFSYNAGTDNFALLSGFPVNIPSLPGTETIVIAKDSTGRIFATYEGNNRAQVLYTTTADHKSWSSALALSGTVDPDDISTIVAFGGNKIGVLWSDQVGNQVAFRWRNDSDSPGTWQPAEVVRSGFGNVDDHLNMKADSQGRVFIAGKDFFDGVYVARRNVDATWTVTTTASGLDCGTRPLLQIDESVNKLYVFYTRWGTCVSTGNHAIEEREADLDNLLFTLPTVFISANNLSMNNISGTKDLLPAGSLAVLCDAPLNSKAYWHGWGPVSNIGGTPPSAGFPPPPPAPTDPSAQSVTEGVQSRVMLWRMDATTGTSVTDATGHNHTGTFGAGIAAPHWGAGLVGNGLYFDGDDIVTASGSSFAYTNTSYTIETWLKEDLTNAAGSMMIATRGDTLHWTFRLLIADPNIEFSWSNSDTSSTSVNANKSLRDGLWHHLAAVWDKSAGKGRIYVDGQQVASKSLGTATYGGSFQLQVGGLLNHGLIDKQFTGSLDNLAITNSALYSSNFIPPLLYPAASTKYMLVAWTPPVSPAGINGYGVERKVNGGATTVLNTALPPTPWYADLTAPDGMVEYGVQAVDGLLQPGLYAWSVPSPFENTPPAVPSAPQALGWSTMIVPADAAPAWEMDEASGPTTADATGLGHNAYLGSVTAGDNAEPTRVYGVSGKALHFDGSNDYVQVPDSPELRFTGSFTIEAWVKRGTLGVLQSIIAKDEGSAKRNYLALLNTNGTIEFSWRDIGGQTRKATSTAAITDNVWHHVACVYDAAAAQSRVFVDGVQSVSASTAGTPYTGPEPVRFGARGSSSGGGAISDPLSGDIDLVRITNGVRYTGSFTPPDLLHGGPKKPIGTLSWALPPTGLPNDYRVYRQLLPAGANTLLNTVPATQFSIQDWTILVGDTYRYTVKARNSASVEGAASNPLDETIEVPTDAGSDGPPLVPGPALRLAPNPFNPSAVVSFRLDHAGPVDVAIYDVLGRHVATLFRGSLPAGVHRVPVTPPGATPLASGVYMVRLAADGKVVHTKAVMVR